MTEKKKLDLSKLGITLPGDVLEHARAAVGSLSFMKELKEMRAMVEPSYLKELRSQMEVAQSVLDHSHLTSVQGQMASVQAALDRSYLTNFREQMGLAQALIQQPYLETLQNQVGSLQAVLDTSYLTNFREQVSAFNAMTLPGLVDSLALGKTLHGAGLQAELAAALVSYQDLLHNSALASFLVEPSDATPPSKPVDIEGTATIQFAASGELRVVPADSVDLEIIQAIGEGSTASLPAPAAQRLLLVYRQIIAIWDMLLRIVNTYVAITVLSALMSSASVPADIPKKAEQLTNEQRELLADYRIVNRDKARLRAEPSKEGEVIVKLGLGLPVEVLEYNGKGWYRVVAEYQDEWVEGWIHLTVTTKVPRPKRSRDEEG